MHPAPSLIFFTVLSGLGFGHLAYLGMGLVPVTGWAAFWHFALGYALVLAGLSASALHLGRADRALKAFSQWRTSWLSREAWLAASTLVVMAPHAVALVFFGRPMAGFGGLGAFLALQTVLATAMIYAQLATVPRWNHWTTPVVFLTASLTGGGLIALGAGALPLLAALGGVLVVHWLMGDSRFAQSGTDAGTATGLGGLGKVRLFEPPHTGSNYVMREMVHVVGRRHARKLRLLALAGAVVGPGLVLLLVAGWPGSVLALVLHLGGMLAARWLFFAQAEHVVGHYYGRAGGLSGGL
jgi:DMSO reductase anchor subunit